MFDNIRFTHSETKMPISSRLLDKDKVKYDEDKIDRENIYNAEFCISGSIDAFLRPPVTDYARNNICYMQAFNIFHYKKGSFTKRQNYNSFLILYTYKGEGLVEYGGAKYTLKPGDGIIIDCRKPHYYIATEDWDVAVLHFWGGISEHMIEEYESIGHSDFHDPVKGRFHRNLEELIGIYDSPSVQRDLRAAHCLNGILLYLILRNYDLAISNNNLPVEIQRAMKHMEENYAQQISLDDLADLTNMNKFHFSKEFKRYTSFPPHEYLITIRINQAKLLLKNTTLPALKIAHEVGIHDINNFNYLFKKRVGKTPIQYRNSPETAI